MKTAWRWCGVLTFWLTWPGIWLVLHGSTRTRLLVVCGDEVIVVQPWLGTGQWLLPGGGLHKGENSLDGALRELYEETGARVQPSQVRRRDELVYRYGGFRFNYVLFMCTLRRKVDLHPQGHEINAARWVKRQELSLANARPDVMDAIAARWPAKVAANRQ